VKEYQVEVAENKRRYMV